MKLICERTTFIPGFRVLTLHRTQIRRVLAMDRYTERLTMLCTDGRSEMAMRRKARIVGQSEVDPDSQLTIKNERLQAVSFSGRRLDSLYVAGSRLERCQFDNLKVGDACLGGGAQLSEYLECSFDGSRMSVR